MIFFSVKSEFETLVQVIITNGEKEGGGGEGRTIKNQTGKREKAIKNET
jgi:hypothetical protein